MTNTTERDPLMKATKAIEDIGRDIAGLQGMPTSDTREKRLILIRIGTKVVEIKELVAELKLLQ